MRKFGIITDVSGLQCGITVNSITPDESAETNEARNDKGKVTDIKAYSIGYDVVIQGVVDDEKGTIVGAGSKLTVAGKDYMITGVSKPENCTAFYEATINAHTADNAVIHVYEPDVPEVPEG